MKHESQPEWPGPLHAKQAFDHSSPHSHLWRSTVGNDRLQIVADCYGSTREEAEKLARLLAAAPDLLESLQSLILLVDEQTQFVRLNKLGQLKLDLAKQAIARADGRSA